jgi:hypothetical protein
MNIKTLVIAVSVTMTIWLIGLYFIIQEDTQCDTHVTLTDGEEYDCNAVHSFDSGMTRIKLCDGKSIDVPTVRIKTVIEK